LKHKKPPETVLSQGELGATPLYTLSDIVDLVSLSEGVTSKEWKQRLY